MFVINTLLLFSAIPSSNSSSNLPALPTNGDPSRSSFIPGPSPMNIISASVFPSPGTVRVLVLYSAHAWHTAIFSASSEILCVEFVVFIS